MIPTLSLSTIFRWRLSRFPAALPSSFSDLAPIGLLGRKRSGKTHHESTACQVALVPTIAKTQQVSFAERAWRAQVTSKE